MLRWKSSLKPAAAAADYRSTILADSPVAYYRLGESSGTTASDETGSYDATYTNSPTLGEAGAISGDSNTSVLLASNEYAEIDSNLSITAYPFTIEAWVKTTATADSTVGAFVVNTSNKKMFALRVNASGYPYTFARNTSGVLATGTTAVNDGNWHHIVSVFAASNDRIIYVDGYDQGTHGASVTLPAINRFSIGRMGDTSPGSYFNGTVDEVAVYNTALSASTIASHYAAASGDDNPGTTNLVNDWSMDETSGTRADSHGSADLTDNNTVTSATGVISNAASFDPANSEYLSSSTQPVTGTVARATECWFKTSYSGTDSQCITDYGSGNTGERWRIEIDDGGLVALRVFGATKIWDSSWNDGNWHHLVMQVAASSECDDVEVYVDGTLDTSASGASATVSINTGTGSQRIGIRSNTTKGFNGQIDEFRNWNRVLTSAEITWLYNGGSGRSYSAVSGGGATSYKDTVLADNPLFYYRLGEASGDTSGNMYDEVATANNGTYYNTPTLGQTGAISGDSNTAVKFEEANSEYADTVTLTSETSLLPCTIECFIKTDGASDNYAGILFARGTVNASGLNLLTSVGKLGYTWNDASNTYTWPSAPTLSDDTWYYVALVVEASKATIYVIDESGTLTTAVNSVTHAALDFSNDPWRIGRDPTSNRYFQGWLDEVAIYDQALSQSTVVAHAAAAGFTA